MKLRTFLISSASFVIGIVLLVFSIQTDDVFQWGFDQVSDTQTRQLTSIARAAVESRFAILKSFNRVLRADNDLSGSFVLAEETGDFTLVRSKLAHIRSNIGIDIAEIASERTPWAQALDSKSSRSLVARGNAGEEGIVTMSLAGRDALVYFSPISLYGSRVGVLVIGYVLNGPLHSELESLTGSSVSLSVGNSHVGHEAVHAEKIPIDSDRFLSLRVTPAQDIGSQIGSRIRKQMLLAGAISLGLLVCLFYFALEFGFMRSFGRIVGEANRLIDQLDRGAAPDTSPISSRISESKTLNHVLQKLATSIRGYQARIEERTAVEEKAKREVALVEQARQVGHNIGSPLTALELALADLTSLTEANRSIVRGALGTIRDITNVLTRRTKVADPTSTRSASTKENNQPPSVQLISHLIDVSVTEKRLEYRSSNQIEIIAPLESVTYGLFARVEPSELKCIISNLVNNAVEAIGDRRGRIVVSSSLENEKVVVSVQDSGQGIPPDLLPRLAQQGVTHGKPKGTGQGLYHARRAAERWGGRLSIESVLGRGTIVTLELPPADSPSWFVPELNICSGSPIVVLDDDTSIHRVWDARFSEIFTPGSMGTSPLHHFSHGDELRHWVRSHAHESALYLIDYELIGQEKNGLDLIEELQISQQSILVTSGFDEKPIFDRARWLDVRMIPKGLARLVPVAKAARPETPLNVADLSTSSPVI